MLLYVLISAIALFLQVQCVPNSRASYSAMKPQQRVEYALFNSNLRMNIERVVQDIKRLSPDQLKGIVFRSVADGDPHRFHWILSAEFDEQLACDALREALDLRKFPLVHRLVGAFQRDRTRITPDCFRPFWNRAVDALDFDALEQLSYFNGEIQLTAQEVYELIQKFLDANQPSRVWELIDWENDNDRWAHRKFIKSDVLNDVFEIAAANENISMIREISSLRLEDQPVIRQDTIDSVTERALLESNHAVMDVLISRYHADATTANIRMIFERAFAAAIQASNATRIRELWLFRPSNDDMREGFKAALMAQSAESLYSHLLSRIEDIDRYSSHLIGVVLVVSASKNHLPSLDLILRSSEITHGHLQRAFQVTTSSELMRRMLNPHNGDRVQMVEYYANELLAWAVREQKEMHLRALLDPQNRIKPSQRTINQLARQYRDNAILQNSINSDDDPMTFTEIMRLANVYAAPGPTPDDLVSNMFWQHRPLRQDRVNQRNDPFLNALKDGRFRDINRMLSADTTPSNEIPDQNTINEAFREMAQTYSNFASFMRLAMRHPDDRVRVSTEFMRELEPRIRDSAKRNIFRASVAGRLYLLPSEMRALIGSTEPDYMNTMLPIKRRFEDIGGTSTDQNAAREISLEEFLNMQANRPEGERDSECAICSDEYADDPDKQILKLPCSHCFHDQCVGMMRGSNGNKCPCCRRTFKIAF